MQCSFLFVCYVITKHNTRPVICIVSFNPHNGPRKTVLLIIATHSITKDTEFQICLETSLVRYGIRIPAWNIEHRTGIMNYSLHSYHQFSLFVVNGKDGDNMGTCNSNKINQEIARIFDVIDY